MISAQTGNSQNTPVVSIPDPYTAVFEQTDDEDILAVEYNGLPVPEFISRALGNLANGYGAVPIGRVDPARPELAPHKVAWCRGYHGYGSRIASADEIAAMPVRIVHRLCRGERGVLGLGARLPLGVMSLDVDAYKRGAVTIAEHEARLGPKPPTYFVTAREDGSGNYLYRVPVDWFGVGVLKGADGSPGDVDTIQSHLRYIAAPGTPHHTGAPYRLYGPDGNEIVSGVLPKCDVLPWLPPPWCDGLYRKPRRKGVPGRPYRKSQLPDIEDIEAVAQEWVFNDQPYSLVKTVTDVGNATDEGQTRPAYHRALWIAARKARAGCYPLSRAVAEIKDAAVIAYATRGLGLDIDEFERSIQHAVAEALDMTDAELVAWGVWLGPQTETEGTQS